MRWTGETYKAKKERLGEWHTWFAWYPVRLQHPPESDTYTVVWLEMVERMLIPRYDIAWWRIYRQVGGNEGGPENAG